MLQMTMEAWGCWNWGLYYSSYFATENQLWWRFGHWLKGSDMCNVEDVYEPFPFCLWKHTHDCRDCHFRLGKATCCPAWWHMPAVLVLRRLKQENHKDKARMLGYVYTYILVYLYVYIHNLFKTNKQTDRTRTWNAVSGWSVWLACMKPWCDSPAQHKLDIVANACNFQLLEMEAGRFEV